MPSIWRAASEPLTALGIPVSAYLPLFGWMYFPSWLTFYVAAGVIIMFGLGQAGLDLERLLEQVSWFFTRRGHLCQALVVPKAFSRLKKTA